MVASKSPVAPKGSPADPCELPMVLVRLPTLSLSVILLIVLFMMPSLIVSPMIRAISSGSRTTDAASCGRSTLGLVKSYFGKFVIFCIFRGLPWKSQVSSSIASGSFESFLPTEPRVESYFVKSMLVYLKIVA